MVFGCLLLVVRLLFAFGWLSVMVWFVADDCPLFGICLLFLLFCVIEVVLL